MLCNQRLRLALFHFAAIDHIFSSVFLSFRLITGRCTFVTEIYLLSLLHERQKVLDALAHECGLNSEVNRGRIFSCSFSAIC